MLRDPTALRDPLLVATFRVHRITTRLHLAILESPLAIPMAEPQLAILEPQPAIPMLEPQLAMRSMLEP